MKLIYIIYAYNMYDNDFRVPAVENTMKELTKMDPGKNQFLTLINQLSFPSLQENVNLFSIDQPQSTLLIRLRCSRVPL